MSDDTIAPSPLLDRDRVAEAIRRGVRLELDPVYAKAAVHGMPVGLTEEQSLAVADLALEALVKAHPIDGREWLVKANKDWRQRAENAELRRRAMVAYARGDAQSWRRTAITAWVYFLFLGVNGYYAWHWPRWYMFTLVPALVGIQLAADRLARRRAKRLDGAR